MTATTMVIMSILMTGATILPQPTGEYAVGYDFFIIEDESRPETFTDDEDDHRVVNVELWYPAPSTNLPEPQPYIDMATANELAEGDSAETIFLATIRTWSYRGVDVLDHPTPFPVVLFSHGHGTHPRLYTTILEEVASHGYVVAAINHTYSSVIGRLDESRTVTYRTPWEEGASWAVQGEGMEMLVELWARDARFVLDWLTEQNERSDRFRGRLDLDRVAGMGHSLGGPSIGVAAMDDERLRATIHLDSSIYGGKRIVHDRPLMLMNTEDHAENRIRYSGRTGQTYYVVVAGSEHMSYSDTYVLEILSGGSGRGAAFKHAESMVRRMNALITQFLARSLFERPAPDLDFETRILRM